jgi:hypothetical protein
LLLIGKNYFGSLSKLYNLSEVTFMNSSLVFCRESVLSGENCKFKFVLLRQAKISFEKSLLPKPAIFKSFLILEIHLLTDRWSTSGIWLWSCYVHPLRKHHVICTHEKYCNTCSAYYHLFFPHGVDQTLTGHWSLYFLLNVLEFWLIKIKK